ncbi:arylsulfatase [Clostridium swellfunianum]|uniref:arylsulfatase n=1 Tax=Clostridium swellfunianum TaxID=1367462 RepID=UPI00202E35B0|nr:arylsulfatase [Clostridium swellfunianum]MCM0646862.1 arylsulfatase [Clostridium swellfunianum]
MKPNVILIEVDQMRGDCLGILGHPVVETPYLDTMASHGYLFDSAYSATPTCVPARASILTGMSQKSHGRVGYMDKVDWNYEHTIASEFANAGYHTQAIGKMHVYPTRNLCGFHNVVLHDGYFHYCRNSNVPMSEHFDQCDDYLNWLKEKNVNIDLIDSGLECNSWISRPWMHSEEFHPTNWVTAQSIDFLRRRDPRKPFFLKMSYVRPHSPLDPPEVYYNQYINEDIEDSPIGDWADTEDKEASGKIFNCTKGIVNKKALKRAKASYYGLITHIDHQIGRFLQVLSEYNCLNNSIILFTSDHGDLLGDHNLFRKTYPYQGSISVPFIIYDPGKLLGENRGQTISKVVELRDIMPTLLDIAGVDIPDTVDGKSIRILIEGNLNGNWREYIHGEHSGGAVSNHYIVTEKDKYIWYSQTGQEQYFNLKTDPKELHDLIGDDKYSSRIQDLRSKLIKELEGREEGYTDGNKLIVGRAPKECLKHIL